MQWPPWTRRVTESLVEKVLGELQDRLAALETAPIHRAPDDRVEAVALTLERHTGRMDGLEADLRGMLGEWGINQKDFNDLQAKVEALKGKVHEQTHAISEGIERTDRSERRIRAVVQRARKELADGGYTDAGLDAEGKELRLVDGERSEEHGVQPVRKDVEQPADAASSIKGVTQAQLARARGL